LLKVVNHLFCVIWGFSTFNSLANEELSGANLKKLREIRDDQPTSRKLKIDKAATIDSMEPFVKAIYVGDQPLTL